MERLMFDTKTARWECEMAQYDDDHVRLRQIAKVPRSLTSTLRHRQGASSSALPFRAATFSLTNPSTWREQSDDASPQGPR